MERVALAVTIVPISELSFRELTPFLRFQAERCDRTRLKTFQPDIFTGLVTIAVAAVFDPRQCRIDLAKQLAFAVTRAQLKTKLRFLGGTIVRVREVRGLVLHVVHSSVDLEHEFALPGTQDVVEMRELVTAHVLFAAFWLVRLDAVNWP